MIPCDGCRVEVAREHVLFLSVTMTKPVSFGGVDCIARSFSMRFCSKDCLELHASEILAKEV